jgi:N-glycosylase/DNA lyase
MVYFSNNNAYIEKDDFFSIDKTFDCGQCFRFERSGGIYNGIAFGKRLEILEEDDRIILKNVSEEEFNTLWKDYFDLDRDYKAINEIICRDKVASQAAEISKGIRILRQDKWEALCSFKNSQNNNIPRIKKIINTLCENFGEKKGDFYAFPAAEVLAKAGVEKLSVLKCGYRAEYIYDAALKVSTGEIDLAGVSEMEYNDAKKYLMAIKGVGPKVADCALLFGFSFLSAFPKDVWIKRVIDKYYGKTFDESIFSPYGGIAQQYLFYYERYVRGKDKK